MAAHGPLVNEANEAIKNNNSKDPSGFHEFGSTAKKNTLRGCLQESGTFPEEEVASTLVTKSQR